MKYRAKFTKGDNVKFVGHLDLLRTIQRSIKRAGLPIRYSNGFNPHQAFSIAQPLSVGQTSLGEYMEFELTEDIELKEVKENLTNASPRGIEILEVRKLDEKEKKVAALVEYGEYKVTLDKDISKEIVEKFIEKETIEVEKETKSGIKTTNIKPDIVSISAENNVLTTTISTGSMQNLKIELLIKTLYAFAGLEYDENAVDVERVELYYMEEGKLRSLMN